MKILLFVFLLVILLYLTFSDKKENFTRNLDLYFSKDELQSFAKYKDYSKIVQIPQGQLTYCDSKVIEEIPQITWNGYFINNMVVYPEYRGKGYGKLILQKIIEKGRKEGKLHLLSQVKVKNNIARNLHDKMGFKTYFRGLNEKNEEVIVYVYYF
tara:strand:+ start:277 stop:741 length:465 start_codon:yes stop_codon:yes gene_type:complete